MDRVEEIESAITSLPPEDFQRIAKWFHAIEQTRWDWQMDRDSAAGRLEFLFQEAQHETDDGLVRERSPAIESRTIE